MVDAFLGEVRPFTFNLIPTGWIACDGTLLAIAKYPALFEVLGTIYGGDGEQTFAIPDPGGRAVLGTGRGPGLSGYMLGESVGSETVILTSANGIAHVHSMTGADAAATNISGSDNLLAQSSQMLYGPLMGPADSTAMSNFAIVSVGGDAHENMQPSLVISYCICTDGYFPSRASTSSL